jgi:hypothetical protein
MLLVFLLIIVITAAGFGVTYAYDNDSPFIFRIAAGVVIGLTLLGFAGVLTGLIFGVSAASTVAAGLLAAAPLALLQNSSRRQKALGDWAEFQRTAQGFYADLNIRTTIGLAAYVSLLILLWFFFQRAMIVLPDGGIGTGAANNLGDLPYHLLIINGFTAGQSFPPENPIFSGSTMSYPFIADLVAAMFTTLGASVRGSMFAENYLLIVASLALMSGLTFKLTKSLFAAAVAPFLLVLAGGLGFLIFFGDAIADDAGVIGRIFQLKTDYTLGGGPIWRWGNPLTTLFVTQRTLLLGLPLALIVFTRFVDLLDTTRLISGTRVSDTNDQSVFERPGNLGYLILGMLAGLLPLVHSHTFLVVVGVALVLTFVSWRNRVTWAMVFLGIAITALPQLIFIKSGSASSVSQFIGWDLGWDNGDHNALWFWFVNTGLVIPLVLIGISLLTHIYKRSPSSEVQEEEHAIAKTMLYFFLPFVLIFIGANLVRVAPWIWDNVKVLIYAYVGAVPIIAWLLARIRISMREGALLVSVLLVSLTLSGWLDVWRVASGQVEHQILSPALVRLAKELNTRIPQDSLIVTAPEYATLPVLTGSRWYHGYTGHVWSHGIAGDDRVAVVKKIYAGGDEARRLIKENGIDYVVVGPQERQFTRVDEEFFQLFPVAAQAGDYRVFDMTDNTGK